MAAPSPWQSSFTLQSSTIIPICYTKRRLLIPWSSDFYSPSSCCCSLNNASGNGRKRLRVKPVELITADADSETGQGFDSPFNSDGLNGTRLSFKSLFGKRALWRTLFFASKKVRSIILLNAITIIYGTALKFVIFVVFLVSIDFTFHRISFFY